MSKILVTGGAGVIGSMVAHRLLELGLSPVLLDLYPNTWLIKDILPRVTLIQGDVLDLPALTAVIKDHKIERIIHLASVIDPTMQMAPRRTCEVIINGTVRVLEAARLLPHRNSGYRKTPDTRRLN